MKIGDKIKKVLENQEVRKRRAEIRAMYYLYKNHPHKYKMGLLINAINGINVILSENYDYEKVICPNLSEYNDYGFLK